MTLNICVIVVHIYVLNSLRAFFVSIKLWVLFSLAFIMFRYSFILSLVTLLVTFGTIWKYRSCSSFSGRRKRAQFHWQKEKLYNISTNCPIPQQTGPLCGCFLNLFIYFFIYLFILYFMLTFTRKSIKHSNLYNSL